MRENARCDSSATDKRCRFQERRATMGSDPGGEIAAALDLVGPRLRRVREQRGVTLTEVAQATGISKSTLSRLENGQRRPSLELLRSRKRTGCRSTTSSV